MWLNNWLALIAFSVLLLVPVGAQNAFAFDVGPSTTISPTVELFTEEVISPIATGWDISSRTIKHDPNAGQWLKSLMRDSTVTFFPKTLIETIVVDPTSDPFSDWHETLDANPQQPSCFVWSSRAVFFAQNLPPGTTLTVTFSPDRKIVDWAFDPPIPPGHEFSLFKFIDCDLAIGPLALVIDVLQFPTVPVLIGGTLIPIDTIALSLAGVQTNALWLIPVIVAATGIGIVIARKL